jgi:hypothetical protein
MNQLSRKEFIKMCPLAAFAAFHAPRWLHGSVGAQETAAKPEKMIAYCGISCSDCPTFIATQKNDDKMREETAKKWSEMFHADIKPDDINCDGCPTDSKKLFNYCGMCEIRKCAREKSVKNCAYCADYPCEKLAAFLKDAPEAKAALDEIRKKKG